MITMMSTTRAPQAMVSAPNATVLQPVMLLPIFMRPVPTRRMAVPVTIGGKSGAAADERAQGEWTKPQIMSAVIAAASSWKWRRSGR